MVVVQKRLLHFLNRYISPSIKVPGYTLNSNYNYPAPSVAESLSEKRIDKIRKVSKLVSECLQSLDEFIKPGITTNQIDDFVFSFAMSRDLYPTPLGYKGFPKSCVTSVNEIICHGIPSEKILVDGDIISVDVSFYKDEFHGDSCRSYLVGKDMHIHPKKGLLENSLKCSRAGVNAVELNAQYADIGKAICQTAIETGVRVAYGICGHGVAEYLHGPPHIGHTVYDCQKGSFIENSVFTIEPCIVEGNGKDFITTYKCLEDNWSLVTEDRAFGSQFEHVVLVKKDSIEILTDL